MKRIIDGILLLDKPSGITSNAALQQVKRLYQAKKAGHTGNLDPLASGVLPICFGQSTKFSRFLLESNKQYTVKLIFGTKTDTGDADGQIILQQPVPNFSQNDIEQALLAFTGSIEQIPPMFSAVKHKGQPLYKLARKGVVIERAPRKVCIYNLQYISYVDNILTLDVECSKGTYIRTLAENLAEHLNCCAHVIALRRTKSGPFAIHNTVQLDFLVQLAQEQQMQELDKLLLPVESSLQDCPKILLSSLAVKCLRVGERVLVPPVSGQGFICLVSKNDRSFIGVGEIMQSGEVKAVKVLNAR